MLIYIRRESTFSCLRGVWDAFGGWGLVKRPGGVGWAGFWFGGKTVEVLSCLCGLEMVWKFHNEALSRPDAVAEKLENERSGFDCSMDGTLMGFNRGFWPSRPFERFRGLI